jgi:hypothetical protein
MEKLKLMDDSQSLWKRPFHTMPSLKDYQERLAHCQELIRPIRRIIANIEESGHKDEYEVHRVYTSLRVLEIDMQRYIGNLQYWIESEKSKR